MQRPQELCVPLHTPPKRGLLPSIAVVEPKCWPFTNSQRENHNRRMQSGCTWTEAQMAASAAYVVFRKSWGRSDTLCATPRTESDQAVTEGSLGQGLRTPQISGLLAGVTILQDGHHVSEGDLARRGGPGRPPSWQPPGQPVGHCRNGPPLSKLPLPVSSHGIAPFNATERPRST